MTDALDGFSSGVKCAGLTINYLQFAVDIDHQADSKNELNNLTARIGEAAKRYGMEISTEKTK